MRARWPVSAGRSHILNHITQRAKNRKEKLYALFVDLKAAFDTVVREKLWEIMEKKGISKYIIEKIKGCYKETQNKTWVLVEKPKKEKILDLKWIYTKKSENVYKAKIVVRGYQQTDVVDDIYSPVAKTLFGIAVPKVPAK